MSTSHVAQMIEEELGEAAQHLSQAIENMKKAIAAVESAENKPALKTPELESIKGLLEVGFRATSSASREWHKSAAARAYDEAER